MLGAVVALTTVALVVSVGAAIHEVPYASRHPYADGLATAALEGAGARVFPELRLVVVQGLQSVVVKSSHATDRASVARTEAHRKGRAPLRRNRRPPAGRSTRGWLLR